MWQQTDCSVGQATAANPSGCQSDLFPFVAISFSPNDNGVGSSMAFFNVNHGDVPLLKLLADTYAMSDNFGDGPRIPLIVISRFSTGGKIDHSYADHVSIAKFIERNWALRPITGRSRDNLPNPVTTADNPYVPTNMPALSDLFGLFDFTAP